MEKIQGFGMELMHIFETLLMVYKIRKILAVIFEVHITEYSHFFFLHSSRVAKDLAYFSVHPVDILIT